MTTESTDKPDLKTRVQEIIDSMINPAVAGHGGFVELIDVQDNRVYLVMGGGCQGCGAADVTLKAGIERLIKEEIPEVAEVLDTTDHGAGSNPYYTPGQGYCLPGSSSSSLPARTAPRPSSPPLTASVSISFARPSGPARSKISRPTRC